MAQALSSPSGPMGLVTYTVLLQGEVTVAVIGRSQFIDSKA